MNYETHIGENTTFTRITINGEPEEPEPVVGPGMILERGRERFILGGQCFRDEYDTKRGLPNAYYTYFQRRKFFGEWTRPAPKSNYDYECRLSEPNVRAMLLSGFRVIRPADPTSQQGERKP